VSGSLRYIGRGWGIRLWCLALVCAPAASRGQQSDDFTRSSPIIEFPNLGPIPGGTAPAFGPGPGAVTGGLEPPTSAVLGNRRRGARVMRPGKGAPTAAGPRTAMNLPLPLPAPAVEQRRSMVPTDVLDTSLADDEGPPTGLTLDAAIERMMVANHDIRALRQELPQADADIITAGLRSNPLIYMDTQFIPYGSFSDAKPGGPTQYDVNITQPLDLSRKRQARTVVARLAKSALEAQFQDIVRRQIANVGTAFVGLQAARLNLRAAEAVVRRREAVLAEARRGATPDDAAAQGRVEHLEFLFEQAQLALAEAAESFADAQESLAVLVNEPPEMTAALEPRGGLYDRLPPPPPLEELTRLALACRPDVRSLRVGVGRARAEVDLQRANRFDDVFLFYDPITIQDNSPSGKPSASSWALGLTCALPVYNRNQGNIARAESNVRQTREELSSVERRVVSEVRLADREFQASRRALEQVAGRLLPLARASIRRNADEFARGELSSEDYQSRLEEAAEVAQSHRDALIRHRRAMLDLNTAVGLRLLP
jgi:cobalt-zinc-cadmium efflux system outer membrane protein